VLVARRWHLEIQTPKGIKVSKQTSALETENKFSSTSKQKQKLDKNKNGQKAGRWRLRPLIPRHPHFLREAYCEKEKKKQKQ
jgi:hypothetical protein